MPRHTSIDALRATAAAHSAASAQGRLGLRITQHGEEPPIYCVTSISVSSKRIDERGKTRGRGVEAEGAGARRSHDAVQRRTKATKDALGVPVSSG